MAPPTPERLPHCEWQTLANRSRSRDMIGAALVTDVDALQALLENREADDRRASSSAT